MQGCGAQDYLRFRFRLAFLPRQASYPRPPLLFYGKEIAYVPGTRYVEMALMFNLIICGAVCFINHKHHRLYAISANQAQALE